MPDSKRGGLTGGPARNCIGQRTIAGVDRSVPHARACRSRVELAQQFAADAQLRRRSRSCLHTERLVLLLQIEHALRGHHAAEEVADLARILQQQLAGLLGLALILQLDRAPRTLARYRSTTASATLES